MTPQAVTCPCPCCRRRVDHRRMRRTFALFPFDGMMSTGIAEIYAEMGKPEKQKAYLAEARKREAR